MSIETIAEQGSREDVSVPPPFPTVWWGRVFYGLFVTALPILSFSSIELLKPEWQTGNLSDYFILILFPQASFFFFPLLAYSIICYVLLLFNPTRFAGSFVVRAGIYAGILLALQYTILVMFASGSSIYLLLLTWTFPFVFSAIYRWLIAKWTAPKVDRVLFMLVLTALLVAGLITRGSVMFLVWIVLVIAAPFWSLLLALRGANWLFKNYETRFSASRGLGLITWLAAYGAAWRFDILKMYEMYTALPVNPPPDCYIATAAARGHPQLVGAWTIQLADGNRMQVNAQLQRLKCVELALMAVHPCCHKVLRGIYDKLGKLLARQIRYPYLADLAYLLLKPWEWLGVSVLRGLLPEIDSISKRMYRG